MRFFVESKVPTGQSRSLLASRSTFKVIFSDILDFLIKILLSDRIYKTSKNPEYAKNEFESRMTSD